MNDTEVNIHRTEKFIAVFRWVKYFAFIFLGIDIVYIATGGRNPLAIIVLSLLASPILLNAQPKNINN